jgi:hypothetical protein
MRLALVQPPDAADHAAVAGLAGELAARGHDVALLAGTPAEDAPGVRVLRHRAPHALLRRRAYEPGLAEIPAVAWRLLRGSYDVAHAFAPAHAFAAVGAAAFGGPPPVVSLLETPARRWLVAHRYRLPLLLRALEGAAATTVGSAEGAAACRRYLLRDPVVAGMDAERLEALYEDAA